VRILVTNDDGVGSPGLHAIVSALAQRFEVVVIAPQTNQSAVARGISLRRALLVSETHVAGAVEAFAVDGTPVDCVRFAALGLAGAIDAVVSGVNLGYNLGDDVTYSGTVAAAFEGLLLGLPAVAVSQAPRAGDWAEDAAAFDFTVAAQFAAALTERAISRGFPDATLLNVNVPAVVRGVRATTLGRRVYRDHLELVEDRGRERVYRIYGGADHSYHAAADSDFAAVNDGMIAVTPLHFDLSVADAHGRVAGLDLEELL
jgi:5'-nucleotidase